MIADRFTYPVSGGYKRRGEAVRNGEYVSTNPIGAVYPLRGGSAVHEGDDIAKMGQPCYGDPVYAIANGVVTFAQDDTQSTWRQMVEIEHTLPDGSKVWSRFAHLREILVRKGQTVTIGQPIGAIGDASGAFVAHLHHAICVTNRMAKSPLDWPSTGHTLEQAKEIVATNYTDPLTFIQKRLSVTVQPTTPQQMIKAAQDLLAQALAALTPAPSVPPSGDGQLATVNSDIGLNVRTAPSVRAALAGKLPNGETVTVSGEAEGDGLTWCKVVSGAYAGNYVAKSYLVFGAPVAAVADDPAAVG